ncbi:MAG: pyruvate dehydrogenase (acetyl-transferring) E1 component subunit alpha, partial [Proteobacteria bacterium]|nr:pyruvate dehydrogenase (acetyl-transferring) E1 component subunit alpha [Pseudomonadota bacterium]
SDHTTADDARRYRGEDEVKAAWEREPVKRLRAYLTSMNAWTDDEEKEWLADCAARVDEEIDAYLETKPQPVNAMFDYTYAELPLDLERQRADALAAVKG